MDQNCGCPVRVQSVDDEPLQCGSLLFFGFLHLDNTSCCPIWIYSIWVSFLADCMDECPQHVLQLCNNGCKCWSKSLVLLAPPLPSPYMEMSFTFIRCDLVPDFVCSFVAHLWWYFTHNSSLISIHLFPVKHPKIKTFHPAHAAQLLPTSISISVRLHLCLGRSRKLTQIVFCGSQFGWIRGQTSWRLAQEFLNCRCLCSINIHHTVST